MANRKVADRAGPGIGNYTQLKRSFRMITAAH